MEQCLIGPKTALGILHRRKTEIKDNPNGPPSFRLSLYSHWAMADLGHSQFHKPGDLYGLYDPDGILRYAGVDEEACWAYAELFGLQSIDCSLLALPEPSPLAIRDRKPLHRISSSR